MKRIWTIIGVRDVPGSFKWYQSLFGQPETRPSHDYFGQISTSPTNARRATRARSLSPVECA